MLLAIDVGNSQTVCGIFSDAVLIRQWRLKTDRQKTGDELAAGFQGLFTMAGLAFADITAVIIASVVPTQQMAWRNLAETVGWPLQEVDNRNLPTGMEILIDQPSEVGADRIVNAVAAYALTNTASLVVDFGTAITFDCVSETGAYIGGAIVPGISIAIDALASRTAKLPRVDISSPPPHAIGTNTVDAIKSGILLGYGSMVDGLVRTLTAEFPGAAPVIIATGGMASIIAPYAESIDRVEPTLTLEGLRLIHERTT